MRKSGESKKPAGPESRKRLELGIRFGMGAGLAALVFSSSYAN